jgi:hypothetical protein
MRTWELAGGFVLAVPLIVTGLALHSVTGKENV